RFTAIAEAGRVPKRPNGSDCKSDGLCLRWFESIRAHDTETPRISRGFGFWGPSHHLSSHDDVYRERVVHWVPMYKAGAPYWAPCPALAAPCPECEGVTHPLGERALPSATGKWNPRGRPAPAVAGT